MNTRILNSLRAAMAAAVIGLSAVFVPVAALAYDFAPLYREFQPFGPGSQQEFTITNPSERPVAVQLSVFSREIDENGVSIDTPNTEDFIAVPPQMVVAPGQSRVVRVRYIGETDIDVERAYRLRVAQVPVQLDDIPEGQARMNMAIDYLANMYVAPPRASSNMEPLVAQRAVDENGDRVLRVLFRNTGNKRAVLDGDGALLRVSAGGQTVEIGEAGQTLDPLVGFAVFPGAERAIELPWPEGLPDADPAVEGEFRYLIR